MGIFRFCTCYAMFFLSQAIHSAIADATAPANVVVVRTNIPFVPGAIMCSDLNTVNLMVELYRAHFTEAMQDAITKGQSQLIRGVATPEPALEKYGCHLFHAGTRLILEKSFGGADLVQGRLPDGRVVDGVTSFTMVQ